MYLKSIKLAGFKSFVDPTTIPIRSSLSAIVGPNGCGKSNVVDAIRWVIGETSAKQLRGQSMTDVIFNGTASRKPIGKANVELIFDNSHGRMGGEFAKYAELSVKREVSREGTSNYYLNGTLCRRKDIIHLFLGTGLGARSYAIIEQGMVSRLIEAKPEELRVFIEEAAGISKYKERRKETESRIRSCHENMNRVNDILEEIDSQLKKLHRQSKAAEKYQELKAEESLLQAQYKALQWQVLDVEKKAKELAVAEESTRREEQLAKQRHLETDIEKTRLEHHALLEAQSQIQKEFYLLSTEIARLEQKIKDFQERSAAWAKELIETTEHWEELTVSLEEQKDQISDLTREIHILKPQLSKDEAAQTQAKIQLSQAEASMQHWQEEWDRFQQEQSYVLQQGEVNKTNIVHYKSQREQLIKRQSDLTARLSSLNLDMLRKEIIPLQAAADTAVLDLSTVEKTMETLAIDITSQRQKNATHNQWLKEHRAQLLELEKKQASLQAIQKTKLNPTDTQSTRWLSEHGLDQARRLGEQLQVESGWETAVEMVLQGCFDAICTDELDSILPKLNGLKEGQFTFIEKRYQAPTSATTLASKVKGISHPLLNAVKVTDHFSEALTLRKTLQGNESVITKEGIWLGVNWARVLKSVHSENSILLRQQELEELAQKIPTLRQSVEDVEKTLLAGEQQLLQLEKEREAHHRSYQNLNAESAQLRANLSIHQTRLEEIIHQIDRIQAELTHLEQEILNLGNILNEAEQLWNATALSQDDYKERREAFLRERDNVKSTLEKVKQELQGYQSEVDEAKVKLATNETQLELLHESIERQERQLAQLMEKKLLLESKLSEKNTPLQQYQAELQVYLLKRQEIEGKLHQSEEKASLKQQELEKQEKQRNTLNAQLSDWQSHLEKLRMERQTLVIHQQNIETQLKEAQQSLEVLIAELPENANIAEWKDKIQKVSESIQRLGPINLAAIDEFHILSEREQYLKIQQADLNEALSLLESAIRKIDRETKSKFKDTFDKVNQHFQILFPKVFGGGQASLELCEDDLLKTGIVVKAQPPGKKNTTIHMLSGGEKALTAISLVFALFELNPAPFCVLDEVDAPLDDVNVGRYCDLISGMANSTQFIIISHNKVTISRAEQLMGVTMQEPGVSRVVSVNMAEAIAMVE